MPGTYSRTIISSLCSAALPVERDNVAIAQHLILSLNRYGRGHKHISRLFSWATKGGFAIIDSGLTSGSNFLMSILLARWMSAEQYGSYALAFSLFLLILLLYQALVLEPMMVFGSSDYRDCMRSYIRKAACCFVGLGLIISTLLAIAAVAVRCLGFGTGLSGALSGLAFATPCIFYFWFMRRLFYLTLSPGPAASGALVYLVMVTGGVFLAHSQGMLSPFAAFFLMGVGALSTGLVLMVCAKANLPASDLGPSLRETITHHWRYGRWAFASCIASWIPGYIYFPVLSAFAGITAAGELRALMNLSAPISQAYAAMSMLLLPYATRAEISTNRRATMRMARLITGLFLAGALAYWALVIPLRDSILALLYARKYTTIAFLVPWLAIESLLLSIENGPAIMLRAMKTPASLFTAKICGTLVTAVFGIAFACVYGTKGALAAMILSNVTVIAASVFILKRRADTHSAPLLSDSLNVQPSPAE
jgi:O-antigen/teichoic acid export membrane protein